jgi:7,8-dihydropterin-6-yl-methyl-4-(beta-D-ribofuranosyl)aminobenzene 5'-phosphate synthase
VLEQRLFLANLCFVQILALGGMAHTLLFDTGPEGTIFIRNCSNLGIRLGEVESIAVTHGHWDHKGALPAAIDAIVKGRIR